MEARWRRTFQVPTAHYSSHRGVIDIAHELRGDRIDRTETWRRVKVDRKVCSDGDLATANHPNQSTAWWDLISPSSPYPGDSSLLKSLWVVLNQKVPFWPRATASGIQEQQVHPSI